MLSSGALSGHSGVGAPAAALLAAAAAADRLRLHQPVRAARGGRVAGAAVSAAANQRGAAPGLPASTRMRESLDARVQVRRPADAALETVKPVLTGKAQKQTGVGGLGEEKKKGQGWG